MRVEVILAAAGRGLRVGAALPKQYLPLGGEPLVRHSLRQFDTHPLVDGIVVVVDREEEFARRAGPPTSFRKIRAVIRGGRERQDSVYRGLAWVDPAAIVLIHDAVRPFVTRDLISSVIEAAGTSGAAVPVRPVTDTPKLLGRRGEFRKTLIRSRIVLAQTPQGFSARLLREAHEHARKRRIRSTDDAALVERLGHPITLVPGNAENQKITTREDLEAAEGRLRGRKPASDRRKDTTRTVYRTGIGFDQHPLVPGRKLCLGGVRIPYPRGLQGHSDADVLVHAVGDALLGAAGLGDLGALFPDSDPRHRGVKSLRFLSEIGRLLRMRGFRVGNLDATVVAEEPLLSPFRDAMRGNIAGAIGCDVGVVSVKASRSGGLGPVGRGEGLSALCVVLLEGKE